MRLPVSRPVAAAGLPSSAARSALRAACGDGCAGQPLVGWVRSGSGAARAWGLVVGGRQDARERGMAGGVVAVAVLPEAPDHVAPGATEDAQGVLVGLAARAGALVDVGRPR